MVVVAAIGDQVSLPSQEQAKEQLPSKIQVVWDRQVVRASTEDRRRLATEQREGRGEGVVQEVSGVEQRGRGRRRSARRRVRPICKLSRRNKS